MAEQPVDETRNLYREKVLLRFNELPTDPFMCVLFETALHIEAMEQMRKNSEDTPSNSKG